jgi:hypothetical protein
VSTYDFYPFAIVTRDYDHSAYFCFLVETLQTALNGADVFYWFIEGFGDVERLKDSHFSPIDIPIIHATISFVVQAYFCYRIWILSKRRSAWLCVFILIVRPKFPFPPNSLTLLLHQGFYASNHRGSLGRDPGKHMQYV